MARFHRRRGDSEAQARAGLLAQVRVRYGKAQVLAGRGSWMPDIEAQQMLEPLDSPHRSGAASEFELF